VQETQLLSATSSVPVTQTTTTQPGTPQRRVIILPARRSISPIKVSTSPKRILSPPVLTCVGGSTSPVCAAHTNRAVVDQNKFASAVRTESDSVCVASCVSSASRSSSSEADVSRTLSTTLHVDGVLTSSSESASRHGIVSVACRGSLVQETSVLNSVTSVTRSSVPACTGGDKLRASPGKCVTAAAAVTSGHVYQSGNPVGQVSSERIIATRVTPASCELSVHQPVAVARSSIPAPRILSSTRTVSVRKICPSVDVQKCNIVVKLFSENSSSLDMPTVEQHRPANIASSGSVSSPKRIVLRASTAASNTSGVGSPVLQRSVEDTTSVNMTTMSQPCSSLQTVSLVTGAANDVSTMSGSASQKVTEAMTLTLNCKQNNQVVVADASSLTASAVQLPAENSSSNDDKKSDDDSDDDSVVIIDADLVPTSPPSPCRNSTKRSAMAQNVILLNRHRTLSQHSGDAAQSAPKAVVTDRKEHGSAKRKSVLGTRLLESASDEGVILPSSNLFQNGSRISQPNRRKSLPQRRTDTSVPQLQFCTKQWKRDMHSGAQSATTSPTCQRSQSRSPKNESDLQDKADRRSKSKLALLSQSSMQCSQNSCDSRKRKPFKHREQSTLPDIKRSKRMSPAKLCNTYRNRNTEVTDNVARKDAAVVSGTSFAAYSTKTSNSTPASASSCSSNACGAASTNCYGDIKPVADSSSEGQLLGKDKRSMEMSVTNEDGVVENLVVTIIDISSSDEEDDVVEVHSVSSSVKLDSPEVLAHEGETSQSKSLVSSDVKTPLQNKSTGNSTALASGRSKSCKPNRVPQKCQQTVQSSTMGRKVLVKPGKPPLNVDRVDSSKIKQLDQSFRKSNNRKRSKNDGSGTIKQTKADCDSVSAGSLGPVVHLCGSKDSPTSCSVVSGARDADDDTSVKLKQSAVVLNSSCYPTSFKLQDSVPWRCVFCQQGSSYRTLGDLFGPYYARSDTSTKADGVTCHSSPPKSRSSSAKKSPESGYTIVSKNSQRRHQQLQKYVPSIARKSPKKNQSSPNKRIPSEIWLHEDCAIWTSGICFSPTGQLCGLEAAVTLSLQMVYSC